MRRLSIMAALLGFVLMVAASSASAEAPVPWWHLRSMTNPSYLQPSSARELVFQLTVSASEGQVTLRLLPHGSYGTIPVSLSVNAGETPEEVVTAFEVATTGFTPPGLIVEVTASPGPYNRYETYVIKVMSENDLELSVSKSQLSGGPATAEVKQVSEDRLDGEVVVVATNLGTGYVNPAIQPVTIADKLPPGVEAVAVEGAVDENFTHAGGRRSVLECSLKEVSCVFTGEAPAKRYSRTFSSDVPPYEQIEMRIWVRLKGAKTGAINEASITGGGAPPVSARRALTVSDAPVPFGGSSYELTPEEAGGGLDTQAGSHPFQFTATYVVNSETSGDKVEGTTKDLYFKLPPGFIGNPTPFPQCKLADFLKEACPLDTVLGVSRFGLRFAILGFQNEGIAVDEHLLTAIQVPLYNIEPAVGEPARFGFIFEKAPVLLDTSVRTGSDYGVTVTVRNITQEIEFLWNEVTFWGVPGDERHDESRGEECLIDEKAVGFGRIPPGSCQGASEVNPPPLLSMPTSCTGQLRSTVEGDSWAEPLHVYAPLATAVPMPAMDGCNRLPFEPSIKVAADGTEGSSPSGLSVDVHVNQEAVLNGASLADSTVRGITVALPEGVSINPSGAGGLEACSEGQVGFEADHGVGGFEEVSPGVTMPVFSSKLPAPLSSGQDLGALGFCADASKIGTVKIHSPLLPHPLEGAVYLASQNANPFGSLVAMYIVAEDPVSGVLVKLPGQVHLSPSGEITTTFEDDPQLPFEDAELHFFGGERAPLSTPPLCGSYTTSASFEPWTGGSSPSANSTFDVTSGPNGSPCESPRPFQPGFEAGTTSVQAGGYSPLTITMSRPDADQQLGKLSVVFPPGVSAGLRGVKLCEEPQAATGECPAESQIGTVTVSAGLGGDPYPVETGKAYITGPYEGDPFGVDVVVPAIAGPFNLGTEVVRSKVDVDPTDAHLTVVSDAFPTILDGIPLELQHINVLVNRPGFVFNPTSCEPMKLTGVLGSNEGATADVSTPFQVTNCAALSFKPEFKVSTSAKTSRVEGASLHVSLTLPNTPRGTGANVAKVRVSLPKQLPSPLKTLQKACTEKVFAENPSNCPKASRVGEAKVETPVLEGPLSGPAYFVSHGGAKYPELIIVLTGEDGVTVQVHGETFISKQGITTATFGTVPDVPFSNFELELPEREYPALTANGNLCKGTLLMPTEMVGQNGFKINQETKISVTGCPKAKKASHKRKKAHHHAKSGGGGRKR